MMQTKPTPCKKLYRSRTQRIIAGVCGGLAEYFNVDPTWVRVLFIIFFIAFGSTAVIYIGFWIIVPNGPKVSSGNDTPSSG